MLRLKKLLFLCISDGATVSILRNYRPPSMTFSTVLLRNNEKSGCWIHTGELQRKGKSILRLETDGLQKKEVNLTSRMGKTGLHTHNRVNETKTARSESQTKKQR